MRLWRLVRLVRDFFTLLSESISYAVEKKEKISEFPKNVTFLHSFPFWNCSDCDADRGEAYKKESLGLNHDVRGTEVLTAI